MRWISLLALAPLGLLPTATTGQTPAQSPPAESNQEPVITIAGQSFATWEAYVNSDFFHENGKRCGTLETSAVVEQRPTSDCTASSTTIKAAYDPPGHNLYRIPVVVHIIQSTSGQGAITNAKVNSQITILNEDFRAILGTNGEDGTDARVEFFLATEDPSGNPTTGITRSTNDTWFNDGGSYWNSLAWDPSRYMNIYTNTASGNLGYVPGLPQNGIVGANSDRVVILWSSFGNNGPIGPPYNKGRTTTHEVGHYLGLYHPFDNGCGTASCYTTGDRICDTNSESAPVFGCPGSHSSCSTSDPFHNYMDYSDDLCMTEFTAEQINRMRCTLENWRVALPEIGCPNVASNNVRNGGLNPNVYTATTAVLGSNVTLQVTDASHTSTLIWGYALPANVALASGYVRLINTSSAKYFSITRPLPMAPLNVLVPTNPALCGVTCYSQAILLGGPGTAWTNAVDMTAGSN